jgi:hypothetical protein
MLLGGKGGAWWDERMRKPKMKDGTVRLTSCISSQAFIFAAVLVVLPEQLDCIVPRPVLATSPQQGPNYFRLRTGQGLTYTWVQFEQYGMPCSPIMQPCVFLRMPCSSFTVLRTYISPYVRTSAPTSVGQGRKRGEEAARKQEKGLHSCVFLHPSLIC